MYRNVWFKNSTKINAAEHLLSPTLALSDSDSMPMLSPIIVFARECECVENTCLAPIVVGAHQLSVTERVRANQDLWVSLSPSLSVCVYVSINAGSTVIAAAVFLLCTYLNTCV